MAGMSLGILDLSLVDERLATKPDLRDLGMSIKRDFGPPA